MDGGSHSGSPRRRGSAQCGNHRTWSDARYQEGPSPALLSALRAEGLWPPVVPSPVLIEALHGDARDALANRFLKTCEIVEDIPETLVRRAASLRTGAHRGSAIDALVVASAEPGGSVLTSDPSDLAALAAHAHDVHIERV